ncbi:KR domain-containing protein [Paenibacillus sp. GSMTC-2017]|uniref:beta-ketoacyl synthase N-terminal-like domain-containing protein n=1 Tax=Paenibacillus sp. GSMTC-2017 TaxID=2794350 RepID=UPI0018D8383A|nr:KR domain-containing protein [Paenibacillus sp. GSMTC-2017]
MIKGDIAIIGLDITLPGCSNQEEVWRDLKRKRISKGNFPLQRLAQIGLPQDEELFMPGSYLEQIDLFDHKHFKVSQKSADFMDPNQRLALLSTTRALRDANCLHTIKGSKTSVYASANSTQQYQYQLLLQEEGLNPDLLGMLNSTISSRINYVYDLAGPSMMTDTACSSSLVSVIQASNDLRLGKANQAIVVSTNIYVKPGFKKDKIVDILASDGKTRTFDDRSTGTSIGEGVCAVILKRKEDAERDGDYIYGLIRSYAYNNDGQTMNMSSPNPQAQARLIEEAWSPLENELSKIAFIEAHGTGTAVGDTIEFESLSTYFSSRSLKGQSVALTACKSNFGHLDVASGLFSLIKSVLSLRNHTLIPHPDFKIPNEEIDFQNSVFYIPDQCQPINEGALAGVSSFGMTGTNAHVVLQAWEGASTREVKEYPPLQLNSYWYPRQGNTFKIHNELHRAETDRMIIAQFPLHSKKHWEIHEHKFGLNHLMVGTSIFEIMSQALGDTAYSLENYEIGNLHLLHQLAVQEGPFTIIFVLDKVSLKATVSFTHNGVTQSWLQFDLREKKGLKQSYVLKIEEMDEIAVTSQVGETDDSDIVVSKRWDVVDKLWVNTERTRSVIKLRIPEGLDKEFAQYAFYPSILDPAFNALNRMAEPNEILFPWIWTTIDVVQQRLQGQSFFSEIVLQDRTEDDRGNVILSFDVNMFDELGGIVLIAKGYKVKNAPATVREKTDEQDQFFKREELTAFKPMEKVASADECLHVAHESLRGKLQLEAPVIYFEKVDELYALDLTRSKTKIKQVYLWDRSYENEHEIVSCAYDLGQLMLLLNRESVITTFNYISQNMFHEGSNAELHVNAHNRAIAMGVSALRLEVQYGVTIFEADYDHTDLLENIDAGGEVVVIQRRDQFYALRFKSLKLTVNEGDKFRDGGTVLIVGGGSGIGRAYMTYAANHYPAVKFIAAGRSSSWNGELPADNVQYVSLDIVNEDQLDTFAREQNDGIDMVLNFAGEPAQGFFLNKTRDVFHNKTRSKVEGSTLLGKYFPNAREIIHFSSLASLIGAIGQVEYCLSNAYQSGLALSQRNVRTLNLTGWIEVGMSAGKEDYYFEKLKTDKGVKLLDRFIHSDERYASMFKLVRPADEYCSLLSTTVKQRTNQTLFESKQEQENGVQSSAESIQKGVLAAWKQTLGDDEYDDNVSFFEQGGDSITIVNLSDELNRIFPNKFDVTTLFSLSTIHGQVELLLSQSAEGANKLVQSGNDEWNEIETHFDATEMLAFLNQ